MSRNPAALPGEEKLTQCAASFWEWTPYTPWGGFTDWIGGAHEGGLMNNGTSRWCHLD